MLIVDFYTIRYKVNGYKEKTKHQDRISSWAVFNEKWGNSDIEIIDFKELKEGK